MLRAPACAGAGAVGARLARLRQGYGAPGRRAERGWRTRTDTRVREGARARKECPQRLRRPRRRSSWR